MSRQTVVPIFLDEVGELAIDLQSKFLRLLQQGEFQRVGGSRTLRSDVRIVAATNRNLKEEITSGNFREDLYYRLNMVEVRIPPLRERKADIPVLCMHMLSKLERRYGIRSGGISTSAMAVLQDYRFPGNVRQLENIISRAYAFGRDREISAEMLPEEVRDDTGGALPAESSSQATAPSVAPGRSLPNTQLAGDIKPLPLDETMKVYERQALLDALEFCGGNRVQTAKLLEISRRTLYYKLDQHGIQ